MLGTVRAENTLPSGKAHFTKKPSRRKLSAYQGNPFVDGNLRTMLVFEARPQFFFPRDVQGRSPYALPTSA